MTAVEQDNTGTQPVEQQPLSVQENPKASDAKDADRNYVVLKRGPQASPNAAQTWEFVTDIPATSAEQALRRAAEAPGLSFLNTDGPTTLVAVPHRSFNPVTLTVKTETTIVIT